MELSRDGFAALITLADNTKLVERTALATRIVRAAIPGASTEMVEWIIWERTCYPFGGLSVRDIYKAANRWHRAHINNRRLCGFCDRIAEGSWVCDRCQKALSDPSTDRARRRDEH